MIRFMGRQERGQRQCPILLPAGMEIPLRGDGERPTAVTANWEATDSNEPQAASRPSSLMGPLLGF
jgi:hypothetical protein